MPTPSSTDNETTANASERYSLSGVALTLSSIGVMGFSLVAFLALTALEAIGGYHTHPPALMFVPLLALPGAAIGSVVSWRTKREWPFYVGLAVSLLPIVLAFVLPEAFDPTLGNRGSD
jgi:hypothetical protein